MFTHVFAEPVMSVVFAVKEVTDRNKEISTSPLLCE